MKRPAFALVVLFFFAAAPGPAQEWVGCGTQWIRHQADQLPFAGGKILAPRQGPEKIEVGTQMDFLRSGNGFLLQATCQYISDHAYIFVEDNYWDFNGGPVTLQDVERLGTLFDQSTPADPERGIYQLAVEAFGQPVDFDGDPRIFIMILDIPPSIGHLAGYFDGRVSSYADSVFQRDTIYLNQEAVRRHLKLAHGTLAHEFQHLIHWGFDQDEEIWIDEGLAGYAEELVGFAEADPAAVPEFLVRPGISLTDWRQEAYNYGATYLFTSFLAERYGASFIRQLVAESRNGIFGVEAAFDTAGIDQDFVGAWGLWVQGNYAVDIEGYEALQGRRAGGFDLPEMPIESMRFDLPSQWNVGYLAFQTGGSIEVDFAGEENGRFRVWAYGVRGAERFVREMELDDVNQGRIQASQVDSLALIVGRTSSTGGVFTLGAREVDIPTLVAAEAGDTPGQAHLQRAFPNPFNGQVLVPFELLRTTAVELSLFNSVGQHIRTLKQGHLTAGYHQVAWDGRDDQGLEVGSGAYLVVLQTAAGRQVAGLTLVK
ncbi:MAG: hypothetical protein GKR89_32335 [Candidatus Latescibacteria bacterium]|nr:hypothetical protein [Candidatus Latescibacterota bacterium]